MTAKQVEDVANRAIDKARDIYLNHAIQWIVDNDNPGDDDNIDSLSSYLTVCLVADLFEKSTHEIAARVYLRRHNEEHP